MPLTGLDAENKGEAAAAAAAAPNDNENPPAAAPVAAAAAPAPTTTTAPTPTGLAHSNDRALLIATRNGMMEHVTHLLRRGASNVHVRDPVEQKTPLLLAAEKDLTELVELLLRFHANVHDTCPQGMTALHYAAWQGNEPLVRTLLLAGANVDALNHSRETPLHGAAHFAFLGVVKILVQDHNADTNIPSRAQLIPLQEVQQKTDKRSTRKAILQLLNETSPETLYSVLFAGCAASTTQEWLGRMLRAIKSLPTCKIFYTIVKAALKLELLTSPQQAQEWIEKAMEHVMRYCKSPVDFETLSTVVEHAAAEHDLSPALADVLRQFCRQGQSNSSNGSVGSHDSVDWNMKKAIRREILSFRALEGIDGKPSSIQRCLEFWQAAVAEMASARTDPWMAKRKALTGIMGAVLNAILLGNHNHINNHLNNPFFDQSVLYVTDFLNFHHMKQFVDNNRDWNRRRNSAVDELNRGRDKCETLLHQLGSSSSPWLEKGFVVLGLCSTVIPPREMSFGTSTETVQMGTRIQTTHLPNRNNRDRIHQGTTLLSERHLLPEESQDEPPRQSEPQPQQLPDNASLGGDSLESRQTSSTTGAPFSAAISHSTATSTHTGRTALSSRNNTVTRETATNLHWAIVEGSHEKVVAELERIRTLGTASINALDSLHRTPLDLAALSGQEEMALLIEASGGERSYFKTDQQMRAVMAYCSNDIPGNRHGLLRAYVGSTRGSSRSTSSSLTSKASRSTRSRRSDGRSVASSSTRTSGSRLRRGRAPTTVRFSAQQTDEQAA